MNSSPARVQRAQLIVLPDNETPFDYLADGRADVMFTDSEEALYRQRITPGLCAVRPDHPYTHVEKVFLFRKDQGVLRDDFDRWLVARGRKAP